MEIDDKLLKRINRQLRAIRIMLTFFFLLFIAMLAIICFIAYKVITFTQQVNNKINSIEQTTTQRLDIKGQLCEDTTSSIARQFCQ
jgi:predicted PurR-regulated permease PerM